VESEGEESEEQSPLRVIVMDVVRLADKGALPYACPALVHWSLLQS
jgi:hypothetical protein